MRVALIAVAVLAAACQYQSVPKPDAGPQNNCSGSSYPCTYEYDVASCSKQVGCAATPEACSGQATACGAYTDQFICQNQTGCLWDSNGSLCIGGRTCDALTSDACETTSGCTWTYFACTGTASPCEGFHYEETCSAQLGCYWRPS